MGSITAPPCPLQALQLVITKIPIPSPSTFLIGMKLHAFLSSALVSRPPEQREEIA
jgi:hypothetical protein